MAKHVVVFISEEACSIVFDSPNSLRLTPELLDRIKNRPAAEVVYARHAGRRVMFDRVEARELRDYFRRAAVIFSTRGEHDRVRICADAVASASHALWTAGESRA